MRDIFSDMQVRVGCQYISDLPRYRKAVWFELCRMPSNEFESSQLDDFSRYVFGMSYPALVEIMRDLGTVS